MIKIYKFILIAALIVVNDGIASEESKGMSLKLSVFGPFLVGGADTQSNDFQISGSSSGYALELKKQISSQWGVGAGFSRLSTKYQVYQNGGSIERGQYSLESDIVYLLLARNISMSDKFVLTPQLNLGYNSFSFQSGETSDEESGTGFFGSFEMNLSYLLLKNWKLEFGTGVRYLKPNDFRHQTQEFESSDFPGELYHSVGIQFNF